MARILAYTSPATGHLYPLVPGLLELQRRGHQVHIRTLSRSLDEMAAVGLDAASVDPATVVVPGDHPIDEDSHRLENGLRSILDRAGHDAADLTAAINDVAPDLLIVDVNCYGACVSAEASGIPWALAMPSLLPLPGRGIPPYSLGMPPARGVLGRLRDAIMWPIVERAFGRALLPELNVLRRRAGLPEFSSPLDQWDTPDLVLALTGEPLEYPRTHLPANVAMVGFQPWDPPAQAPAYLDEPGDPWVLVTCSTEYQGDESLARVAAEALRGEPFRVLLTLADAYDQAGVEPGGNIYLERFVSHAAVLRSCAAVVTHSGMGIVGKATAHGVPIVSVPFGRDQPEIARRIMEAGVGVRVGPKELSPDRLRQAVREAVALRPRVRQVAVEMAAADPAGAFADAVDRLAQRNADDRGSAQCSGLHTGFRAARGIQCRLRPDA